MQERQWYPVRSGWAPLIGYHRPFRGSLGNSFETSARIDITRRAHGLRVSQWLSAGPGFGVPFSPPPQRRHILQQSLGRGSGVQDSWNCPFRGSHRRGQERTRQGEESKDTWPQKPPAASPEQEVPCAGAQSQEARPCPQPTTLGSGCRKLALG